MAEDDDEARAAGPDEAKKAEPDRPKSGDTSGGKEKDGKPDDQKDRRTPTQKQADERKARRRKILIRLIFLLVLVVAAIGAFLYWFSIRDLIDTDDAYTEGRAVTIAPRIAGQVVALDVSDNQRVRKGDVLIRIDPRDYKTALDKAAAQLTQAQAQLSSARIDLDKAATTYPADLLSAQGSLEQAQGNLANAQSDYNRQHTVARAATTQQQVDQSTASLKQAEGQVKVAQAKVDTASLVQQNIDQASARVQQLQGSEQQAQSQYDQAKLNLSYTTVRAPQDGWVTRRGRLLS
jgi:membrane fusion protein, multidrug efflux system